jgi:hypothetical protein
VASPLMFVRDGRTLPFIPVTAAALEAIRRATPKRRPYAVTTYMRCSNSPTRTAPIA